MNEDIDSWLKQQFELFSVYQAPDEFKKKVDPFSCISFVYDFIHNDMHDYLCDEYESADDRISEFVKDFPVIDSHQELTDGDIIVYQSEGEYTHIALYLCSKDYEPYAISKYGVNGAIYIHPIQNIPQHYGEPVFYRLDEHLKEKSRAKLSIAREKVFLLPKCSATNLGLFSKSMPRAYSLLLEKAEIHVKKFPENKGFLEAIKKKTFEEALKAACSYGGKELLCDLLEYTSIHAPSFNINATFKHGMTARDLAEKNFMDPDECEEVLDLLDGYSDRSNSLN